MLSILSWFRRKSNKYCNIYKYSDIMEMSEYILRYMNNQKIVLFCVGDAYSIGDSIGPRLGTKLNKFFMNIDNVVVVGTMEQPVNYSNINDTYKVINALYKNPFIIGIDACVGDCIDNIIYSDTPLHPGRSLNRNIQAMGNISFKCVVAKAKNVEYELLTADTKLVDDFVNTLYEAITLAFIKCNKNKGSN